MSFFGIIFQCETVYKKKCKTVYRKVLCGPDTETECSTDCDYYWQGEGNNLEWVPIPGNCRTRYTMYWEDCDYKCLCHWQGECWFQVSIPGS